MTKIDVFKNLDYLNAVRNNHLNPLILRVEDEIVPALHNLDLEVQSTFRDVNLDIPNKTLVFERSLGGGKKNIELAPIMPVFSGVGVQNDASAGPDSGITLLKLKDATVSQTGSIANVSYDWPKIVADNVVPLKVGAIDGSQRATNYLFFKGAKVVHSSTDITTVDVTTPVSPVTGGIPDKGLGPVPLSAIELTGEVEDSILSDGKLTIHLKAGGGGTPLAVSNFKGFFQSMGDLMDEVKDAINGKSYAFVKDTQLGGKYYTPHLYLNGTWTEFKQDPALTYSHPSEVGNHGVFSIKPNEKILVDANGQLNLDGLSTAQDPKHFQGFFESYQDLTASVPRPVAERDLAYVKHANGGWIGYRATKQGSASLWQVFAPIGGFSVVESKTSAAVPGVSYGIYKDDAWELDGKGLLTLKPVNTSTEVFIGGVESEVVTGHIKSIQFMAGASYATLQGKDKDKLFLNHPQRVIEYDAEFEAEHNKRDYEGNIFYDETSRCWMGWGIPDAQGAVDKKWTRIAHPKMSDEVKGLDSRLPSKAPILTGGTLGDNAKWEHSGWSYIGPVSDEYEPSDLPDEIKLSGAYVQTYVKDKPGEGGIPQARMQTCYEDKEGGSQWVRLFDATPAGAGDPVWKKWIRTSFSHKDIEAHEKDLGAHQAAIKYYRVFALTGVCQAIFAQTAGDALGGLHAANGVPMADNYGYTSQEKDYLDVPYKGMFRLKGAVSFSGYNDKKNKIYPVGRWQFVFRKKDRVTGTYSIIGQSYYVHSDQTKPYPTMSFVTREIELEKDQELVTNFTFDSKAALRNEHPNLYLVPSRSNLVLEDVNTRAGSAISNGMRLFFGNLDVTGDVGIKSHHATLTDPSSQIRVYGEIVAKKPIDMTYTT
ncbi:MAG: hypothetical protein ACRC6V_00170 [Bacteroidales bacterium]